MKGRKKIVDGFENCLRNPKSGDFGFQRLAGGNINPGIGFFLEQG
jgi:hypothetical protein